MNCKYDCDCCKNRVIIYDDRGPQGPTAGIYRQPNTNYVQKECAYLEGEPLNIFLECQTPGTTSTEDLLTLPEGKNIDDTFTDGEVTWIIRKLITSSYDGDLKLNGNITANNATIKNKTTTQTLEVLGDGQVNGNFNINRKLTVNEIDCKTNLTIGGQKPLDASALQKIQDQIIAPSQIIYVSNHGNDDNDGSGWDNAIKTLDKAIELVRNNIPTVSIVLDNTDDDVEYPLTGTKIFGNKNNSKLYFSIKNYWEAMNNTKKRPIIKPTETIRATGTQNQYYVGYTIADDFSTLGLTGIRIKYPDNAVIKSGYSPQLFVRIENLILNPGTSVYLIDNAVLQSPNKAKANTLSGDSYSIVGTSSSYLAKTNLTVVTSSNPTDESTWRTWTGEEIGVFLFMTKSRATITGINSNKFAADCKVLYTNI